MENLARALVLALILATVGAALWLPVYLPGSVKIVLGHALLSLLAVGGVALFLARGYAEAMRS